MPNFCKFYLILLIGICTSQMVLAQWNPGQEYFGHEDWIRYQAGNLPLIILAPHGGSLKPSEIQDRDCAGCSTIQDYRTEQLTQELSNYIHEQLGCFPHVVLNHLHRVKLDANRDIEDATDGDSLSAIAWQDWIRFVDTAKAIVNSTWGKGLVIDMHGHGHEVARVELGYLLSGTTLRKTDSLINAEHSHSNSIESLIKNNPQSLSLAELLRGPDAFGSMLDNNDIPSVPSAMDPFPLVGESYFSGGFNTARNGSRDGGNIDAIQIECHRSIRNDGARDTAVQQIGDAVIEFLSTHYFPDTSLSCMTVAIESEASNNITTYPNPASEALTIDLPTDEIFDILIFDNLGRIQYHLFKKSGSQKIILDSWLQGPYQVVITNANTFYQNTILRN